MLKIFLMTKNETKLLEDWIKYHGYIFGLENIHILDGSDDESIFYVYSKYVPLGLNVHFSSAGLNELADELTNLMHENKGNNDFLIKLDTDEFLAYTNPFALPPQSSLNCFLQRKYIGLEKTKGGGIKRRLGNSLMDRKHASKEVRLENIHRMFEELPVTGQRYKASFTMWSLPAPVAIAEPCRSLTQFTPLQFTHIKSFFHSDSFVSVDLGCHNGESTGDNKFIDTGLTLIHYHATSYEDSMRSARQVLLSHKYIDIDDSVIEQRRRLVELKSNSFRFSSRHKVDLYLRHLDFLSYGNDIEPATLYMHKPRFRQSGPPIELTLVRDTLEKIDRQQFFSTTGVKDVNQLFENGLTSGANR